MDGASVRPRSRTTRRLSSGVFAFLALVASFASIHPRPAAAQSQPVTVSKILCYATGCPTNPTGESTVTALTNVFYQVTIGNTNGPAQTVTLTDPLPANFTVTTVVCNGVPMPFTGTITVAGIPLPASGSTVCNVNGQFTATSASVANTATVTGASTSLTNSNTDTVAVTLPAAIPGNVKITKLASAALVNAPATVVYTIKVKNTSPNPQDPPLALGSVLTVFDQLRLRPTSVPLMATYVAGSTTCTVAPATSVNNVINSCLQTTPQPGSVSPLTVNSPALLNFLNWRYAAGDPGMLSPGAVMTLKFKVTFAALPGIPCVIQPGADGVYNESHLALNVPGPNGPQAVQDANPVDNTSAQVLLKVNTGFTIVDPACGLIYLAPSTVLQVTKTQLFPTTPPGGLSWFTPDIKFLITIKNISTTKTVTKLQGLDETLSGLGTPPFKSTFTGSSPCPPIGLVMTCVPVLPPQTLAGYGATKTMYNFTLFPTGSPVLGPGQSWSFPIHLKYSHPDCDSYPGVTAKPVDNVVIVTNWTEMVGSNSTTATGLVGSAVTTLMKKPPNCPLKVLKFANVPKIHFGVPNGSPNIVYTVKYYNPTPGTYTVGTMIDTMRTKTIPTAPLPYAAQLPVQYRYSCSQTAGSVTGGFPGPYPHRNAAWPSYNAASIIPTSLPQQGVRLIQNTLPVTFGPFSSVTCTVQVVVLPPPASDPYCSMHGYLENNGILDASAYYNPNFAWTSPPTWMWSSVSRPLPKCYDVVLNKVAVPATAWTSPSGGPVAFALSILNNGNDPIAGGGPAVQDAFTPPLWTSPLPTAPAGTAWLPPLPTGSAVSKLAINNLGAGQTALVNFSVPNTAAHPYPPAPGQICNHVTRSMRLPPFGPAPLDYYWKHPATAQACIPVVQTASLTVTKALVQPTYGNVSPSAAFTVAVSCALSSQITGPNTALTFTITPPNLTQTINNIPVGSTCSVVETSVPPPTQDPVCNNWIWTQTGMTPSSPITITSGNNTVVVTNTRTCHNLFSFGVAKTIVGVPGMVPPAGTFNVNVSCHGPGGTPVSNYTLTLQTPNALTQYGVSNLDVGYVCTISEVPPPPYVLPSGVTCTWSTTYPQGTTATLSGPQTLPVVNTLNCPPVRPAPSPNPNPVPSQRFVAGDFLLSPKVYDEFSPGNSGSGVSYEFRGAAEFPAFGLPWMVEGDYRSYSYPHTSHISAAATSGPAGSVNPCPHSGLPPALAVATGDQGCVTVIGAYGQTAVPSFSARDVDFDGRLAVQIAKPRIYVGVGYLYREENYGYPAQSGFGIGAEKLPDLENKLSAYGSVWYYPSISGNFTYPTAGAPPALAGTTTKLEQRFIKYEIGGTYALGSSGLFLDAGIKGDTIRGKNAAPSDASHAAGYVGVGIKF